MTCVYVVFAAVGVEGRLRRRRDAGDNLCCGFARPIIFDDHEKLVAAQPSGPRLPSISRRAISARIASPKESGFAKASAFSDVTGAHQSAVHPISARSPADQAGAAQ